MPYTRQYDTRLDIGQMTPSGESGLIGRIFSRDPETQIVYTRALREVHAPPISGSTRKSALLPQRAIEALQQLLVHGNEKLVVHEAGHIVVGLHYGSRALSVHLPVDPAEVAITEFADAKEASPEAAQDILTAGSAAE